MNHKAKQILILFPMVLLITHISGCATIQEKVGYFLEKLKGEQREKQIGTREEAVQRYKYKGLEEELIIEPPIITPKIVSPGDRIKQELQFTLLAPRDERQFTISETMIVSGNRDTIELIVRESRKAQGTHLSIIQFEIPKDLSTGENKLITTISIGEQKKTVSESFRVKR